MTLLNSTIRQKSLTPKRHGWVDSTDSNGTLSRLTSIQTPLLGAYQTKKGVITDIEGIRET